MIKTGLKGLTNLPKGVTLYIERGGDQEKQRKNITGQIEGKPLNAKAESHPLKDGDRGNQNPAK